MAIAVTNLGSASGASASPIVLSVPNGVPAGSVIVLALYDASFSNTATDNASPPNTYFQSGSIGKNLNNLAGNGSANISLTFRCNAIPASTGTITYTPTGSGGAVFSAFYVTGATKTGNNTTATGTGSSTAPTATLFAVPEPNSLVIGVVGTLGPSTDTFTQDSSHAAYATPPDRASLSTTATIAGGSVIGSTQLVYAPTITSRPWAALIVSLAPSYISGPIDIGTGSSTSASQISITPPATIPVGRVICVAVSDSGTANSNLPSDTGGNTYTSQSSTFNFTSGTANGFTTLYTTIVTTALTTSDTISYTPVGSSGGAVTAFYLIGVNTVTPIQVSSKVTSRGSSTTPTATIGAAATSNGSMTIGIVGTHGPNTDTFAQDTTNALYQTPPTRVGNTTTSTIAGGSINRTGSAVSALAYAPGLGTSRAWGEIVVTFLPQLITGVSATGAVGSFSFPINASLTGVAGTGAAGTLATQISSNVTLTGVAGTGAVGTLATQISSNVTLTGVSATGAVGTLATQISSNVTLTGTSATGQVGSLSVEIDKSIPITGVAATGQVGTLAPEIDTTVTLTGVAATGQVGSLATSNNAITITDIGTGAASGTVTIAVPSTIPIGSVVVVAVCDSTNNPLTTLPSDTQGNTYALLDSTLNASGGFGTTGLFYSVTTAQLTTSDTIQYTPIGIRCAVSAFYLSNVSSGTPFQSASTISNHGNSQTPFATAGAAAIAPGTLTLGVVGDQGSGGDTFSQDSTNANYVTPPDRVSGGGANVPAIGGGSFIRTGADESALTYAPKLFPGRNWGEIVVVFNPQILTGVAAVGAVSSVAVETDSDITLTGVAATGAVTAPKIEIDKPITGVSAIGAVTAPRVESDFAITGVAGSGQVGISTAEIDKSITGAAGIGQIGAFIETESTAILGVAADGQVGTLAIEIDDSIAITGVSAIGQVGTLIVVAGQTTTLAGVSAAGQVGVSQAEIDIPLAGVSAIGQIGTFTFSSSSDVGITGVEGDGQVGTLAVSTGEIAASVTGSGDDARQKYLEWRRQQRAKRKEALKPPAPRKAQPGQPEQAVVPAPPPKPKLLPEDVAALLLARNLESQRAQIAQLESIDAQLIDGIVGREQQDRDDEEAITLLLLGSI